MAAAEKTLAQLELLILLAISRLSAPNRHLSQIVSELENHTSRGIYVANIFTSLKRMTAKGYLISREETQVKAGPGRKTRAIYELTSRGGQEMNLALRDISELSKGLEGLWDYGD